MPSARLWRWLLVLARIVVFPLARLRVTGSLPPQLHGGPVILATNHVSPFDPVIMMAACHRAGIVPYFLRASRIWRSRTMSSGGAGGSAGFSASLRFN